jgi:hypothetical protein
VSYRSLLIFVKTEQSPYKIDGFRAPGVSAMLYSLSKQIAHCYARAVECKELAALSIRRADRQFYIEREQAWLILARSYEFQERVNEMVQELARNREPPHWPTARTLWVAVRKPPCPTCCVEMQFQASRPARRVFVKPPIRFERVLFVCPDCRRLVDHLAEVPSQFKDEE